MRAAEVLASRILFWGGALSILLMLLGIIGFAVAGGFKGDEVLTWRTPREPRAPGVYTSIGEVGRALGRRPVEPLAVVATGILLLLFTPVVAVLGVFAVFAAAGDRRYAAIAALLLAALLVGVLFVGR